jgi:hypothetical protein
MHVRRWRRSAKAVHRQVELLVTDAVSAQIQIPHRFLVGEREKRRRHADVHFANFVGLAAHRELGMLDRFDAVLYGP